VNKAFLLPGSTAGLQNAVNCETTGVKAVALFALTLLLFVLRIFAAHHHYHAIAANDFAVFTTRFYRGTYFHELALQV
jgi:hypothetical protein